MFPRNHGCYDKTRCDFTRYPVGTYTARRILVLFFNHNRLITWENGKYILHQMHLCKKIKNAEKKLLLFTNKVT